MTDKEEVEKDAHEIWSLAQLMPGEVVLDGVDRITNFLIERDKNVVCDLCGEMIEELKKEKYSCEHCGSNEEVKEVTGQGYGILLCKKCDPYHIEMDLGFVDDFLDKKSGDKT